MLHQPVYENLLNMAALENFTRYFSVDLALTPEQKQRVYEIRYRVYCEELHYLDVEKDDVQGFGEGMEQDEFDERSIHILVTHRQTNRPAGCVRLVISNDSLYDQPLPMEKFCLKSLSVRAVELLNEDRSRIGEISRLAVDPYFRRRDGERYHLYGKNGALDINHQEKRAFSLVAVAGLMASAAAAELAGRGHVFAMMHPALPRLMARSGFVFEQIGDVIDYHGKRAPYRITADSYHRTLPNNLRDFYYDLYDSFQSRYERSSFSVM
ncbi:MAG: PEP-CTERM/exosortase system-associated acyltransferase [Porticoccaceae bacterium]|nr:PEP-CTERM/exosortase system-associated acyltransferase [Porticoccaceae bacterium]